MEIIDYHDSLIPRFGSSYEKCKTNSLAVISSQERWENDPVTAISHARRAPQSAYLGAKSMRFSSVLSFAPRSPPLFCVIVLLKKFERPSLPAASEDASDHDQMEMEHPSPFGSNTWPARILRQLLKDSNLNRQQKC